jgi:bifunctional non-homologous end joining protein LigD
MPRSLRRDPSTVDLRRYGSLAEYNRKRHFGITPEPSGRLGKKTAGHPLQFVIQKHAASHLHYDFRLEFAGVMKSWAVPKGPALDPSVKRLAMAVEDHPMDYNQFEGVIPEGEYGGGTVMIWDKGVWIPEVDDVGAALAKGQLKFRLEGHKLGGSWALVHTDDRRWLLIKHRDRFASSTRDIVVEESKSVVSRRSMKAISTVAGGTERQIERAAAVDPVKTRARATVTPIGAASKKTTAKRTRKPVATSRSAGTTVRRAAKAKSRNPRSKR